MDLYSLDLYSMDYTSMDTYVKLSNSVFKLSNVSYDRTIFYDEVLLGEFQLDKTIHFMERTNLPIAILVTLSYVAMVYFGQKWMAQRKPLDLRTALAFWNFALSFYSFFTLYKIVPFVLQTLKQGGIFGTVCNNYGQYTDPISGYWTWLFALSKGPELLDTVFLILRKRPVIFLHWYHHSVTYLGLQVLYGQLIAAARWGVVLNASVHTVMYFYFGLKALNIRTPKHLAKSLTLLQIIQFIFMVYMCLYMFNLFINNELTGSNCAEGRLELMPLGFVVALSYLVLFSDFFIRAYVRGQSPTKQRVTNTEDQKDKTEKNKDL